MMENVKMTTEAARLHLQEGKGNCRSIRMDCGNAGPLVSVPRWNHQLSAMESRSGTNARTSIVDVYWRNDTSTLRNLVNS